MCDLAFAFLEIRLSQEVAVRKQVVFALVVYLHIRAKIMLIKFVGAQLCVASPDIQRDWKCHEDQGGSTWSIPRNNGVLKLEERSSYKVDYIPVFGV